MQKQQVQYSDVYILSIPSFTWVKVPDQASPPAARAGHTCNLRDGQMIVVGGYTGQNDQCDSPGVYVFNATSLQWQSSFTVLSPRPDIHPDNSVLAASFGYRVPDELASVIGGGPDGGATATTPAAGPATGGPFATGHPPVYTVTASGSTATITQWGPGATGAGGTSPGESAAAAQASKPSGGLIAAGVIAGLAGVLAGYLGFCAWLYRRQVRVYRTHLAVANRYSGPAAAAAASRSSLGGLAAVLFGRKGSKGGLGPKGTVPDAAAAAAAARAEKGHERYESTSTADDSFAWVGREEQPRPAAWMMPDEPSPGSRTTSSGARRYSTSPFDNSERPGQQQQQQQQQGHGSSSGSGGAGGSGPTPLPRRGSNSGGSTSSTEGLLDDQEPSFFSVVMGPRRALRVVNGLGEARPGDGE